MIHAFWFIAPVLLLSLACVGAGVLCLRLPRLCPIDMPLWLHGTLAYFVGQGVLATAFLFVALAGAFSTLAIALPVSVLAIVAIVAGSRSWHQIRIEIARAWHFWRHAPIVWRVLSVTVAVLFLYGFSSLAGSLWIDAPAFYMSIARLIAGTGRLTTLPGYESFSAVGLPGELLMAALFRLGQPGTAPRILWWVNSLPMFALFYGLARACSLGRRGALLAVTAAASSTAITALWGSGKTDLMAIGPALAACLVIILCWRRDRPPFFLAGLLMGMAVVAKVSYLVAFLPGVAVLIAWQRAASLRSSGAGLDGATVAASVAAAMIPFGVGGLVSFAPNLIKNYVILGETFAVTGTPAFFTAATTARLVLTYPFAITYGRYWGQAGTLSPLVLAFAPLALYYPRRGVDWWGPLTAITFAAASGIAAWLLLFPSVVSLRYFQATLLLFALPVSAAAEAAGRSSRLLSWVIPAAVLVVVIQTPRHTDVVSPTFAGLRSAWSAVGGDAGPCSGSRPFETECAAQVSINTRSALGDRVLVLSYLRLWLDPALMANMSRADEVTAFLVCSPNPCSAREFWTLYATARPAFRFVLHDPVTHQLAADTFTNPPDGIQVKRLIDSGGPTAYEIIVAPR